MTAARSRARVVILVENLSVPFDRRVWQEACALTEAGYEVHVVCPQTKMDPLSHEVLEGVNVHRYRPAREAKRLVEYPLEYGVALLATFWLTLRIARRGRIDVIQACNPPDLLFLVALPFKLFGRTRFIFDHHDLSPELVEAKGTRSRLALGLARFFERLTFWAADVSIATNESYRRVAIERGRMDPQKVFVVRSGPDASRFKGAGPSRRFHNGREFLVAYVGVMAVQDGVDLLIDVAAHLVIDLGVDAQFGLAGSGPEFETLRDRVEREGLGSHVCLLGRVSDDDLGELLASADVCVNPDLPNDLNDKSTMNKVLEYMALGKPIVQFSMTEGRVSAGPASLYVEEFSSQAMGEAIISLLTDPDMRREMGRLGRERLWKDLSWEQQKPALYGAYELALL